METKTDEDRVMQISETRCPKCGNQMESGFLIDIVFPGSAALEPQGENMRWAQGRRSEVPRPGFLSRLMSGIGFRLSAVRKRPVTSLRCVQCGYLELYAR